MIWIYNHTRVNLGDEITHACPYLMQVWFSHCSCQGVRGWVISYHMAALMSLLIHTLTMLAKGGMGLGPQIKITPMDIQIRADHWSIVLNNAYQFAPRGCRASLRNSSVRSWTRYTQVVVSQCDIFNHFIFFKKLMKFISTFWKIWINYNLYLCMLLGTLWSQGLL